jgi:hypothetical protein
MIFTFYGSYIFERVHPLQSGIFRRKRRTDRRSDLPLESRATFYGRRAAEIGRTYGQALRFLWRLTRMRQRLMKDPATRSYRDLATTPVQDELHESLRLYDVTDAARKAVDQARVRSAKRSVGSLHA